MTWCRNDRKSNYMKDYANHIITMIFKTWPWKKYLVSDESLAISNMVDILIQYHEKNFIPDDCPKNTFSSNAK